MTVYNTLIGKVHGTSVQTGDLDLGGGTLVLSKAPTPSTAPTEFDSGDAVVLAEHPDAEVFTITGLVQHPAFDGNRYLAVGEGGAPVLLDPAKIKAAPVDPDPTFAVGDRVRVMTNEVPGTAPRGSIGTVREVEQGFVYVRLDHSGILFPLRAKELVALIDAPAYRKVADLADLAALRPGTVIVNEVSNQVFVKDGAGTWRQPGWPGPYSIEAAEEIAEGLLVVYVPPTSRG
ncbi:hypothetical protein [Saccharothrix sp. HUAS TT1]|uniref:hypothetical protein n=1 Tax=unclassified Saccharothrix TaxID=2593673 RepID=UPI00345BC805